MFLKIFRKRTLFESTHHHCVIHILKYSYSKVKSVLMVQESTMTEERHFRVASHAVVLGLSHAILPHELPSNLISELPLACEQQTYFR